MKEVSVKKNFIYSTIYQILLLVLPFVTTPYVSRILGADGIGIYGYTSSIQTYFAMFAALGTVSYGSREIARHRDDKKERSQLFWEIEGLTIITSIICLLIWFVFAFFTHQYQIYYYILSVNLLATMFDVSWFYMGIERFKYVVSQNTICKILGVIAIFVFVKEKQDLALYVAIMSFTVFFGNLSMWIYLPKYIGKTPLKSLKIMHHFKETIIYFIPTIATSVYTVLDKTLIGVITKDEYQNGYYEQATKIINMAKAVTFASLNKVLGSRISYLFAQKKEEEIKERLKNSISYIMFIGVGCCFGIIGTARLFVPIFFGSGYGPVVNLLYIFAPIILIIGVSNCLGSQYYTPAGYRKQSTKYILTGALVNLILNLVFIPLWGCYGAAGASVLAELVISILYLKNCRGYMTLRIVYHNFWKRFLAGGIMGIVIVLLYMLPVSTMIKLFLQVGAGVAVYGSVLLALRDELLLNSFAKMKKRFSNGGR